MSRMFRSAPAAPDRHPRRRAGVAKQLQVAGVLALIVAVTLGCFAQVW